MAQRFSDISLWSILGWALLNGGLALAGWSAFVFNPTIPSEYGYEATFNLGLLADRQTFFNAGGFLAIAGLIVILATAIRKDVRLAAERD